MKKIIQIVKELPDFLKDSLEILFSDYKVEEMLFFDKVAKLHEKVANQRKDFLHKQSATIAKLYDGICIEDLDMKAMSQALNFGKSVSDNGWGMFVTFLKYKLEEIGKRLVKVDKFFASSQTCSVCGYKNPITKNLSVRAWDCPECGTHHDRDINAAINIRNKGMCIINA